MGLLTVDATANKGFENAGHKRGGQSSDDDEAVA